MPTSTDPLFLSSSSNIICEGLGTRKRSSSFILLPVDDDFMCLLYHLMLFSFQFDSESLSSKNQCFLVVFVFSFENHLCHHRRYVYFPPSLSSSLCI